MVNCRFFITIVILVTMLGNMLLLPLNAHAQQQVPAEVTALLDSGERLMEALPLTLGNALELSLELDTIVQTPPSVVSEPALVAARERALVTFQQAALSQSAIGEMLRALDDLDFQADAAVDVDAVMADLAQNGLPQETVDNYIAAGLSASQVAEMTAGAVEMHQTRRTLAQSGFDPDTYAALERAGLSPTEIDQLAQDLGTYGLAETTLPDRLAQFQAVQEELNGIRMQALVAYLQLTSQQVFSQRGAGELGRDLTPAELDTLAQDQLRLLIHLGYLDDLWGSTPDPDVGEGQWLFIERYSSRVIKRLETLMLETQNVGLALDLFAAHQIKAAAQIALAGDPLFAKQEVDIQVTLLSSLVGDEALAQAAEPPLGYGLMLAVVEQTQPGLPILERLHQPGLDKAAIETAETELMTRIKGVAHPLPAGAIPESNEDNNQAAIYFYPEPEPIPLDWVAVIQQFVTDPDVRAFVIGTLTGQTDDTRAILANMALGFVPVAGELIDVIGLFTEPTIWGKAMALIGLIASFGSDILAALTALGVAIPPFLVAGAGAVSAKAVDIAASVLKNLPKLPDATGVVQTLSRIPWDKAVQLGGQAAYQLGARAQKSAGGELPTDVDEALLIFIDIQGSVIQPMVELFRKYGTDFNALSKIGFNDGGMLVGRLLKQGGDYDPETLQAIAKIGDELGEAAADLSDNAAAGLGKLVNAIPDDAQGVIRKLCGGGLTHVGYYRMAGLAKPLLQEACNINFQQILGNVINLDEVGLNGFNKLAAKANWTDNELAELLIVHADDPDVLNGLLGVIAESKRVNWNSAQGEILGRLVKNGGGLTPAAIKHLPLNSLDETLYPGFAEFLAEAANDSNSYLSKNLNKINNLAADEGNVSSIRGHMANLVGEFREKSFANYANGNGHTSLFKHAGSVNEPGLDALTKKGEHFFLGEIKDRGIGVGTVSNDSKTGSRLSPSDFKNYMTKTSGGYKFNETYLFDKLDDLVDNGQITELQQAQILQAIGDGKLELIIFAGGRSDPFARTLNNLTQLINPLNPNKSIKVRLVIDNF